MNVSPDSRPYADNVHIAPLYKRLDELKLIYFHATDLDRKKSAFIEKINQLLDQLEQPAKVVVAGGFNSGKSSFVNALCGGHSIMPVEPIRSTATVNCLIAGDEPEFVIHWHDSQRSPEEYHYLDINDLNKQIRYWMEQAREKIEHIDIKLTPDVKSSRLTFLGKFTLIDTPGLDHNEADTRATKDYIQQADAIVWLMHYEGLRKDELKHLEAFRKDNHDSPLIAIINQVDNLEPDERKAVFAEVSAKLQHIAEKIFLLSAKQALNGYLSGDAEQRKQSGIDELDNYLHNHLFTEYKKLLDQRVRLKLGTASSELADEVDEFLRTCGQSGVRRRKATREDIATYLKNVDSKIQDYEKQIESLNKKLSELRHDRGTVMTTGTLADMIKQPSLANQLKYLPAIFQNFWKNVSRNDFLKKTGCQVQELPEKLSLDEESMAMAIQDINNMSTWDKTELFTYCQQWKKEYPGLIVKTELQAIYWKEDIGEC